MMLERQQKHTLHVPYYELDVTWGIGDQTYQAHIFLFPPHSRNLQVRAKLMGAFGGNGPKKTVDNLRLFIIFCLMELMGHFVISYKQE